MEISAPGSSAWWMAPEHFEDPLVFTMEDGQEERIFGPGDTDLRLIEVHSQTLIQLEPWFTASGQTRVTVVGPPMARRWLRTMMHSVGSRDSRQQARGRQMLQRVRSRPLTTEELAASLWVHLDVVDVSVAARLSGRTSLEIPQDSFSPSLHFCAIS
ncbi:KHDC1-like protein [Ctenodactylus gundi]